MARARWKDAGRSTGAIVARCRSRVVYVAPLIREGRDGANFHWWSGGLRYGQRAGRAATLAAAKRAALTWACRDKQPRIKHGEAAQPVAEVK